MNKKELATVISEKTGKGEHTCLKVIDAVFDGIEAALETDGKVQLTGFGSFIVKDLPARKARNPRTGETVNVAAKKVVRFKPGMTLKNKFKNMKVKTKSKKKSKKKK